MKFSRTNQNLINELELSANLGILWVTLINLAILVARIGDHILQI